MVTGSACACAQCGLMHVPFCELSHQVLEATYKNYEFKNGVGIDHYYKR